MSFVPKESSHQGGRSATAASLDLFLEQAGLGPVLPPWAWVVLLGLLFNGCFVGLGWASARIEARLGLHPLAWTLAVWGGWTIWHSVLFERHRRRSLARGGNAYRRAFFFHVVPGATLAISQMWRPLLNARTLPGGLSAAALPPVDGPLAVAGLALCLGSAALLAVAICSAGPANAAFVSEYVRTRSFSPCDRGIYSLGRHPMFWSGVLFSLGLALWVQTPLAFALAAVNFSYGLVYNRLEDRRLLRVFGDRYEGYMRRLPNRIPWPALPARRRRERGDERPAAAWSDAVARG